MIFERIILLLNGPLDQSQVTLIEPLLAAAGTAPLVCVDGGVRHLAPLGLNAPQITWVGDNDSTPGELAVQIPGPANQTRRYHHILKLPQEKDLSDFAAALDSLREANLTHSPLLLEIFCGLGGSRSHEEANLREAERFLGRRRAPTIIQFQPAVLLTNCRITLAVTPCRQFSIFALQTSSTTEVLIEGALYDGARRLMRPSHGLNNRTSCDRLTVTPGAGEAIVLFLEPPPSLSP
jgi:thiamine pyrophosphokinase